MQITGKQSAVASLSDGQKMSIRGAVAENPSLEIALAIDEISDYVMPVKGLIKKGIKETIKAGIKEAKDLFGKKKVEVSNGRDASIKNNGDPSKIGDKPTNQSPQQRGRESEARVLEEKGLEKNTQKVSSKEGNSVPDGMTDKQIIEVKDTKSVTNTKQIRIQRDAANKSGKDHVVVTGENTKVSKTVQSQSKVERRKDLGPKDEELMKK